MKKCTKCGIEKKETEFHWIKVNERRKAACKECERERAKEHQKERVYVNPRKAEEAARKEEADLFNSIAGKW